MLFWTAVLAGALLLLVVLAVVVTAAAALLEVRSLLPMEPVDGADLPLSATAQRQDRELRAEGLRLLGSFRDRESNLLRIRTLAWLTEDRLTLALLPSNEKAIGLRFHTRQTGGPFLVSGEFGGQSDPTGLHEERGLPGAPVRGQLAFHRHRIRDWARAGATALPWDPQKMTEQFLTEDRKLAEETISRGLGVWKRPRAGDDGPRLRWRATPRGVFRSFGLLFRRPESRADARRRAERDGASPLAGDR